MIMKNPNRKCKGLSHLSNEEIQEMVKETIAMYGSVCYERHQRNFY